MQHFREHNNFHGAEQLKKLADVGQVEDLHLLYSSVGRAHWGGPSNVPKWKASRQNAAE